MEGGVWAYQHVLARVAWAMTRVMVEGCWLSELECEEGEEAWTVCRSRRSAREAFLACLTRRVSFDLLHIPVTVGIAMPHRWAMALYSTGSVCSRNN